MMSPPHGMRSEDMAQEQDMSGDGATEQADSELGIELGDKIIENASLSYETTNLMRQLICE